MGKTTDFVNLRQSPNGKILAKIYKKDFDNSAVFNISNSKYYAAPDDFYQVNILDMMEKLDPKKPR